MGEQLDSLIAEEFPYLNGKGYFDYDRAAPISHSQIEKIKAVAMKIQPSPHSSEEQSAFDRSLTSIRETLADIFHSSQVSFAVVLFQTREAAIDSIFEGFPWKNGFSLTVLPNFHVDISSAVKFPTIYNAAIHDTIEKSIQKSLYCFEYDKETTETMINLRKSSSGTRYFLCDATKRGTFDLPDLSQIPFDFTLFSFKQICGADLTACLMRLESADMLVPLFYGGGAVSFSCIREFYHQNFKSHSKRFENGTPSMLPIFSAVTGLDLLQKMHKIGNLDERIKQIIENFKNVANSYFEISAENDYTVIMSREGWTSTELQSKFAENGVFFGIRDNSLVASFGMASRMQDVEVFHKTAQLLFN